MYIEGSDLMNQLMGRQFAQTRRRFSAAFRTALPDVDPDEIAWRLSCVVGIVVYMFAGVEASGMPRIMGPDPEHNLIRLLSVTVPLMTSSLEEVEAG
jgi:hypothetical protein